MKPVVAIVGRPNVGKSTLFNRLVGQRQAIVEDIPGTTRDRIYGDADWAGRVFTVVDTGGIAVNEADNFTAMIEEQARQAMEEADVIVFMVDVRAGISQADADVAEHLRHSQKPVLLVANKADNRDMDMDAVDLYRLGMGEPLPISASHGLGIGDLLDEMTRHFLPEPEEVGEQRFKIAIVGRPNVGKSSLLNAILGQERAIVSDIPGTTRDAIDTLLDYEGQQVTLIDTAGIRRRGHVQQGIEKYSVIRALRAIDRCDVACLVVDATEMLAGQDVHIAGYVNDAVKGMLLVVNKWDLVPKTETTINDYQAEIVRQLNFMDWVHPVFVSAKTHQRVDRVLRSVLQIKEQREKRVGTGELNQLVAHAMSRHQPPGDKGRQLRIYYATQASVNPPTFIFFVNDPKLSHFSFKRYLENQIREKLGYEGTAIKLVLKARSD
ncbi:MAG TPA: ribosome biogenesis GTPase Der [Chloroflexota bacterium]|nr:ribosome biogenesis GTPase Der [Chloroflexota bacterium]